MTFLMVPAHSRIEVKIGVVIMLKARVAATSLAANCALQPYEVQKTTASSAEDMDPSSTRTSSCH